MIDFLGFTWDTGKKLLGNSSVLEDWACGRWLMLY